MTGGCMSRLFVDAMPPFVGTWDLVVGKGGILLGFSRNSLLRTNINTIVSGVLSRSSETAGLRIPVVYSTTGPQ